VRRLGLCSLLLVLVLVGCGKSSDTNSSTNFTMPSTTAKVAAKAPAKPTTTLKKLPQCLPYAAYSLAYSATELTKGAKRTEVIPKFEKAAIALKMAASEKASIVDEQITLVKRANTASETPQDAAKQKKNALDLEAWFKSTCL